LVKLFLVDLSFGCEDVEILMNLMWRWRSYVMRLGGIKYITSASK
jgi:hypothetical protein